MFTLCSRCSSIFCDATLFASFNVLFFPHADVSLVYFKSALLELEPPTEMIYEIWKVVFDYTAPDLEVGMTHMCCTASNANIRTPYNNGLEREHIIAYYAQ